MRRDSSVPLSPPAPPSFPQVASLVLLQLRQSSEAGSASGSAAADPQVERSLPGWSPSYHPFQQGRPTASLPSYHPSQVERSLAAMVMLVEQLVTHAHTGARVRVRVILIPSVQ